MDTVLSGIRPTGKLHLGNYFGALKNFITMQNEYNCYFFIADLHSLTTHPTPENIQGNVRQILAEYLAAGLDPEKATIYIQSDVKEVIELYLYLNMNAYIGELERRITHVPDAYGSRHSYSPRHESACGKRPRATFGNDPHLCRSFQQNVQSRLFSWTTSI